MAGGNLCGKSFMTSKTQSTKNKLINWILSKCIKYALQKTGMRQDRRKPLQKHISRKELISRVYNKTQNQ